MTTRLHLDAPAYLVRVDLDHTKSPVLVFRVFVDEATARAWARMLLNDAVVRIVADGEAP